jgi:hypothetical protein
LLRSSEKAVVLETLTLLTEHEDAQPAFIAGALEAAWMARTDVAEVFADTEEIIAALREG